jgi:hypothetical protein
MGELISYTIKGAVLLSVMYAVYMLSMSRMKCAGLRRAALLTIYTAAIMLPLFPGLSMLREGVEATLPQATTITIPSEDFTGNSYNLYHIVVGIAIAGIAVSAAYFTACAAVMSFYHFNSQKKTINEMNVRVMDNARISPFCFCRTIYINREDFNKGDAMILSHEMSHARHFHFIDLIVGRIVAIMQWWNPLARMMMKELHQVHEFQADEDVIDNGFDATKYQYMLVAMAVGRSNLPLGNSMGHSRLKNRLKMINRKESPKGARIAMILMIPAVALSCSLLTTDAFAGMLHSVSNTENIFFEAHEETDSIQNAALQDEENEKIPVIMIDGKLSSYKELQSIQVDRIQNITMIKNSMPEYPNGLVVVELKKPGEIIKDNESSGDTISIRN